MSVSMSQRRIISLFKTFIQKIFVPFIPKMDLQYQKQWNNFSKMISVQPFNYAQVNLYVETLPSQIKTPSYFDRTRNKSPINSSNPRKDSINETSFNISGGGFNPNKTFGGQRMRQALQMNLDEDKGGLNTFSKDLTKQYSKESIKDTKQQKYTTTTLSLQPTLQRLFKILNDSQTKLEKSSGISSNGINSTNYSNPVDPWLAKR